MSTVEELKNNYTEMSSVAKYSFFAGVVIIVLIFVWGISLLFKDSYTVLYSGLSSRDASSIVAELDKSKVKYILEDGGSTILVQDKKVYKTRLKVASNVPTLGSGVGFEIFDKDDFGTTDFAQKINFQRALQGELARTIMALDEIKMARVHLVLPKSSLFKRKESDSRASVTLILKKGMSLSQQQVTGIQKLVSSSTPGLDIRSVTILNQKGITLIGDEEDEHNVNMASKKLERKREIERYLSNKAQHILNNIFGEKIAYVSIDVALNFDNIKTTREQVISPSNQDENITRKKEIRMKGNKKQNAETSRSTIEIEYELSKKSEQIVSTPGSINRMSVAIITPTSLDDKDKERIKNIVANAVGFNIARGDSIAISNNMAKMSVNGKKIVMQSASMPVSSLSDANTDLVLNDYKNEYLNWVAEKIQLFTVGILKSPLLAAILFMVSILVFIFLLFRNIFPKSVSNNYVEQSLSEDDRKQLLSDLKNWLATDSK